VRIRILAGLIVAVSMSSWAADKVQPLNVKLGLWEVSTTLTTNGELPIPADMLAKLTPEQRARFEEKMKERSAGKSKTTVRKSCLTKEKLDSGMDFNEEKGACSRTVLSSTTSNLRVRYQCVVEEVKWSGEVEVEALTPETAKGSMRGSASSSDRTMNSNSTFAARWIGAACGGAD